MAQREFDKVNINVEFNEAGTRQQINSGESVNTLFGKIKKFFSDLKTVAFTGDYNDLNNKPNDVVVDNFLSETSENPIQNKVVTEALNNKLNTTDIADWAKSETKPTYTYDEVGADESGAASTALISAQNYTNQKIADLVNSAPETLDTLGEIAEAIEENENIVEALNAAIGNKVNKSDIDNTLSNTSTNPVQNKIVSAALADKETKPYLTPEISFVGQTVAQAKEYIYNWFFQQRLNHSNGILRCNSEQLIKHWNNNEYVIVAGQRIEFHILNMYENDVFGSILVSSYTGDLYIISVSPEGMGSIKTIYTNNNFPIATNTQIGGIKSGGDITVASDGTVSVNGLADKADKNIIEALQVKVDSLEIEHYAFTINQNEANPDSMITYPAGCDNTNYASAKMNYTTGVFDYSSWGNAFFIKNLRVVMLNYDGIEAYEINKNDYSKKIDGTDVGEEGNVMIAFPKTYYKVVDNGNNTATIHVSNRKLDDDYKCWAHIGLDGEEKSYCYMAAYDGSYVDNKLRSLSGYAPMVSQTVQEEVNRALANNSDSDKKNWYTGVAADRLLVQILLTLISKNTNSQAAFGYGFANSNSAAISSGTMDTKGLFWGESGGKQGVKVFGIENFWGNVWKRTAGWINANGSQKLKMTYGTQDGSTVTGYNFDGSGYVAVNTCPATGWLKGMTFHQFGVFPKTINGSDSTYYADIFYANNNQVNYTIVGGYWTAGAGAGAFVVVLSFLASHTDTSIGAYLSYKKGG